MLVEKSVLSKHKVVIKKYFILLDGSNIDINLVFFNVFFLIDIEPGDEEYVIFKLL